MSESVPNDDVFTVEEAARWLRTERHSVYPLIASGVLPVIRVGPKGGAIRILKADLLALPARQRRQQMVIRIPDGARHAT